MRSLTILVGQGFPDLTQWKKIEKYNRSQSEITEYFTPWNLPWGKDILPWIYLYRLTEQVEIPEIGTVNLAYLVVVKIPTENPDVEATKKYVEHQENLLYPIDWGCCGNAMFIGAKVEDDFTHFAFLIADPKIIQRKNDPMLN